MTSAQLHPPLSTDVSVANEEPDLDSIRKDYVRCLRRRGIDAHLADDLAHEALLRILERPCPVEFKKSASRWYRTVLFNVVRTHFRRPTRTEALGFDPHAPTLDPDAPLRVAEFLDWASTELSRLSPRQRTAMSLRVIQQWTIEDTCRRMGTTRRCLKGIVHRARQRVRARTHDDDFERWAARCGLI